MGINNRDSQIGSRIVSGHSKISTHNKNFGRTPDPQRDFQGYADGRKALEAFISQAYMKSDKPALPENILFKPYPSGLLRRLLIVAFLFTLIAVILIAVVKGFASSPSEFIARATDMDLVLTQEVGLKLLLMGTLVIILIIGFYALVVAFLSFFMKFNYLVLSDEGINCRHIHKSWIVSWDQLAWSMSPTTIDYEDAKAVYQKAHVFKFGGRWTIVIMTLDQILDLSEITSAAKRNKRTWQHVIQTDQYFPNARVNARGLAELLHDYYFQTRSRKGV